MTLRQFNIDQPTAPIPAQPAGVKLHRQPPTSRRRKCGGLPGPDEDAALAYDATRLLAAAVAARGASRVAPDMIAQLCDLGLGNSGTCQSFVTTASSPRKCSSDHLQTHRRARAVRS